MSEINSDNANLLYRVRRI